MALENNLAQNISEQIPSYVPQQTPDKPAGGTKVHKKKKPFLFEKTLMIIAGAIIFLLIFAVISFEVKIASTNRAVQDTSREIAEATIINKNLEQEVQELSRYDRVYAIAKAHGLEMNEENVRNVTK
ncbi:cell division protein FtsL [Pisciglobus halotolerans]|uniref:Cell division protein FtsL n=1 Tax=Pisciglobus halotolerans TaxID=745365 RepID=A0A1I3BWG4_9LACT|nr:cell division protein FtsL [Pisciglobus halotolerans]SFH66645.1 cell division protein FtsL [Pisciglobus halotolerans]